MAKRADSAAIRASRATVALLAFPRVVGLSVLAVSLHAGCVSPATRARFVEENLLLREDKQRLERTVAQQDVEIAALQKQVANLQQFGPDQPADLFAPVRIEIGRLSGGTNTDGKPGDDGITVYLRLRDADGDAVKAPGRISIRLTDDADIASPRVLGVYEFDDPDKLGPLWHSRFGTQHYALLCPFAADIKPATNKVTVHVEFTDYLTGRTLTTVREVHVSLTTPSVGSHSAP
jgi:hypothetical protein